MPGIPNLNMVVSLSSDGNYALSTNTNQQAILWNIKDKTYKIVANHVNIYSAYFIKNTSDFIYQDNNSNSVIVENTNGQIIKQFNPDFPTYGEVMTSDLNTWIGADDKYQLFKIISDGQKQQFFYYWDGPNFVHETPPPKGMPYGGQEFEGAGKLFNLSLSSDEKILLSSGADEFYLWDVQSAKLIKHIEENIGKATATFSPNDQYVVSSDEDFWIYYYNVKTQNSIRSKFWPVGGDVMTQYQNTDQNDVTGIINLKYIDNNIALVFMKGIPDNFNYATLVNPAKAVCLNHPDANGFICKTYPEKYLPLIAKANTDFNYKNEWPMLSDYSRDEAIDTSPSAHILVIAMNDANGILVYKYDPVTQTLNQIWAPIIKSSWW